MRCEIGGRGPDDPPAPSRSARTPPAPTNVPMLIVGPRARLDPAEVLGEGAEVEREAEVLVAGRASSAMASVSGAIELPSPVISVVTPW